MFETFLSNKKAIHRFWVRRHRISDNYTRIFLPTLFFLSTPFTHLSLAFRILQLAAVGAFMVRWRDRSQDPEIEETFLRTIIHENPRIQELFAVETMHVLDYDCEYAEFPDAEEFPEFENKFFRFFNTDSNMTKGFFEFGDLESNATMRVTFETMPVPGKARLTLGEPFYFFDVKAEITHKGVYEEVVLVDRAESLKKFRPYLMMI